MGSFRTFDTVPSEKVSKQLSNARRLCEVCVYRIAAREETSPPLASIPVDSHRSTPYDDVRLAVDCHIDPKRCPLRR